jgi:hypothetical protein
MIGLIIGFLFRDQIKEFLANNIGAKQEPKEEVKEEPKVVNYYSYHITPDDRNNGNNNQKGDIIIKKELGYEQPKRIYIRNCQNQKRIG